MSLLVCFSSFFFFDKLLKIACQFYENTIYVLAETPSTIGSLQSLNMDMMIRQSFQPDYTVRACTEVLYLKVKRSLYLAAKRATLMERSQRDNQTESIHNDQFDDEVEKVTLFISD